MEFLFAQTTRHTGFRKGWTQLHPSPLISQPSESVPRSVEDVIITSEFQRRKPHPQSPALELAALRHLTNYLSSSPVVVLKEFSKILVQVCGAGSAGVTLEERRHTVDTLECVGATGQLASEQLHRTSRHSPCGAVIEAWQVELFRRPERFYSSMRTQNTRIEELLVVPWQLTSGRRGAIWVAQHEHHKHFNQEHLRLVTALSDFTRHALHRSFSEETRRSCEALESAERMANQLAHEVNNPLQALINSLFLSAPQAQDVHVLEAQAQADRLSALVQSLLDVKRQNRSGGPSKLAGTLRATLKPERRGTT
jgi:hypothetical protein